MLYLARSNSSPSNQHRDSKIRLNKVTVCFETDPDLAFRLRRLSRHNNLSEESLLNSILRDYIAAAEEKLPTLQENEFRKYSRVDVSIPAIIEINLSENETQYKPANIINISSGGAYIRLEGKASRIIDNLKKKAPFMMTFCVPAVSQIAQILCKPVHFSINAATEIGACFENIPESLRDALQQNCLQSGPSPS